MGITGKSSLGRFSSAAAYVALVLVLFAIAGLTLLGPRRLRLAPTMALEQPVWPIALAGDLGARSAEVSGMAWYRDYLVVLPQLKRAQSLNTFGFVFVLGRGEIEEAVAKRNTKALRPRPVPLLAPGIVDRIEGFDGFEAIAFAGDRVFVTVEARTERATSGYLVSGSTASDMQEIRLDVSSAVYLEPQADLDNVGYEALVVVGERILALYEANGVVNKQPHAWVFDLDLRPLGAWPLDHLEYRVTDATDTDADGRFWVANYHWPGTAWESGTCPLTRRFGLGATHATCETVERLVELQVTPSGVRVTSEPPVQLRLIDDSHARNWEAVVRLGDRGFLVMTDEHPASILGFVEYPRPDGLAGTPSSSRRPRLYN